MKLQLLALLCCMEYFQGCANANKCFYFSKRMATWENAMKICMKHDLCLVKFQAQEELNTMANKAISVGAHGEYWYAYKHKSAPEYQSRSKYPSAYDDICGYVRIDKNGGANFLMTDCQTKMGFICIESVSCNEAEMSRSLAQPDELPGIVPCVIKPMFRKELELDSKYFDEL